ncbi:hypothetical protein CLU79DRAFT_715465 [Phycomyces nitens]|nr:hypothetical protein CLU79DRAFT_715465 [Phycomyces nitens]
MHTVFLYYLYLRALTKVNSSKISDTLQGLISSNGNEERVVLAAPIKYWSEEMTLKGNKRSFITFEKFQLKHNNIAKTMMNSYTEEDLLFKSSPPFLEKTIRYNGEVDIGYLFQVFDEIGYVAGIKHLDVGSCLRRIPSYLLTGSVEHIHLLLPATVQDIKISGHVVNVGNSSVEVLVKAETIPCAKETHKTDIESKGSNISCLANPTPKTILIAKFNMVSVNIVTGKTTKSNPLLTKSIEEEKIQKLAQFMKESKYSPSKTISSSPDYKPEAAKLERIDESTLQTTFLIPPQDRSVIGYLFGGKTLNHVYDIAYITARKFVGSSVRMHSLDEANFHSKVEIGSIMRLTAQVIYSSQDTNMFQVKVVSRVSDSNGFFDGKEAITANFTFLSLEKGVDQVVPKTQKENELYIEGKSLYILNL